MNQAQRMLQNFLNKLMDCKRDLPHEQLVSEFHVKLAEKAVRVLHGKQYTHYVFADNTGVGMLHNSEHMLPMQRFKVFAHKPV